MLARHLKLLPELHGVLDERDIGKVSRVGYAEAAHAVRVSPLGKVALKGLRTAILLIAAYLAVVVEIEAVQLVEPVRYRLAVPAERQILRIVDDLLLFLVAVLRIGHHVLFLLFALGRRERLLALHVLDRARSLHAQYFRQLVDLCLQLGYLALLVRKFFAKQ